MPGAEQGSNGPMRRGRAGRRLGISVVALMLIGLAVLLPVGARSPTPIPSGATAAVVPLAGMTLSLTGATPTAAALSWTASGLFPTYTLQISSNGSSGPFTTVATGSATTYVATGLLPGASYWWLVSESSLTGSATSNVLAVTQPAVAVLTDTVVSPTELSFNWTNNATYGGGLTFVSYVLMESVGGAPPTASATLTSVTPRTINVTGLSAGGSYLFFVNTSDCSSGCGASGAVVAVTESNAITYGAPLALSAQMSVTRFTVDVGQPDLFTCTPSGGESPFTFGWDWGNGTYVPGTETDSHAFSATGGDTVNCLVTDHLASQAQTGITVVVTNDPLVNVTANRTAVDVGMPINFNCSGSGGVPPYALSWSLGDGTTSSLAELSHTFASAGTFRAYCVLTDGTSTQAAANVSITVSPSLQVRATTSAPAAAPGTSLTFTAAPLNGSGTYPTITWSFGDGGTSSGLVVHHLYASAGDFAVNVTVRDSNGGRATSSVHVAVAPLAVSFATHPPASGATGLRVAYNASATGGAGGPYNFTWSFDDGTTAYGANVTHTFARAGTYVVTLQVSDRLGATNLTTFAPLVVSAPPAPAPLVSAPLLLGIALIVALFAFVLGAVLRRRRHERQFAAVAGRVPVTDTDRFVRGSKVCRVCGTSNVGLRTTCEACGASLRSSR